MLKIIITIITLLIFTPSAKTLADTKTTLTFGVVPQQSASKLARLWRPILNYLEKETNLELVFATAKTIPIFEQRVADGQYDIAYMNPYHFTVFHESTGYEAIAKQKNKRIKGIIVVKKESTLQSIDAVSGSTLAFPAPAAFAASVLPRAYFSNQGIAVTPAYVSSHDSVYLSVAKGIYPAGGGVMRTFNNIDAAIRDQLRVLWKTEGYTPHAIAIHPKALTHKKAIQRALIGMNDNAKAKALLTALNFKGIEAADSVDWDDVRALGIPLLNHLIEE